MYVPEAEEAEEEGEKEEKDEEVIKEEENAPVMHVEFQGPGSKTARATYIRPPTEAIKDIVRFPGVKVPFFLVCDCYPKIYDAVMLSIQPADVFPGALVTCTPSAGKSVFLAYAMWRLLKDPNITIILQSGDKAKTLVWIGGQGYRVDSIGDMGARLDDPIVWYLIDTVPEFKSDRESLCPTLLVASPKKKHYKYLLPKGSGALR